jgi:medium-chain acyl-[acyl-carrier-protein] hydrolase
MVIDWRSPFQTAPAEADSSAAVRQLVAGGSALEVDIAAGAGAGQAVVSVQSSDWFFVPEPRPAARIRLICLPYAGGAPWTFRAWPAALPPDIEVCTAYLPGRGKRVKEAVPTCMHTLAQVLRQALQPKLDKPYAIFGHSLGALLGYSLAQALERAGDPAPQHVFVSGCPAPAYCAQRPPIHELDDEKLINAVAQHQGIPRHVLETPELLALTTAMLRADFRLAASYGTGATSLIESPITAFFGSGDSDTTRESTAQWQTHTNGRFNVRGFPGDHFFLHEYTADLLAAVQAELGL